jgi:hypothetical protein
MSAGFWGFRGDETDEVQRPQKGSDVSPLCSGVNIVGVAAAEGRRHTNVYGTSRRMPSAWASTSVRLQSIGWY